MDSLESYFASNSDVFFNLDFFYMQVNFKKMFNQGLNGFSFDCFQDSNLGKFMFPGQDILIPTYNDGICVVLDELIHTDVLQSVHDLIPDKHVRKFLDDQLIILNTLLELFLDVGNNQHLLSFVGFIEQVYLPELGYRLNNGRSIFLPIHELFQLYIDSNFSQTLLLAQETVKHYFSEELVRINLTIEQKKKQLWLEFFSQISKKDMAYYFEDFMIEFSGYFTDVQEGAFLNEGTLNSEGVQHMSLFLSSLDALDSIVERLRLADIHLLLELLHVSSSQINSFKKNEDFFRNGCITSSGVQRLLLIFDDFFKGNYLKRFFKEYELKIISFIMTDSYFTDNANVINGEYLSEIFIDYEQYVSLDRLLDLLKHIRLTYLSKQPVGSQLHVEIKDFELVQNIVSILSLFHNLSLFMDASGVDELFCFFNSNLLDPSISDQDIVVLLSKFGVENMLYVFHCLDDDRSIRFKDAIYALDLEDDTIDTKNELAIILENIKFVISLDDAIRFYKTYYVDHYLDTSISVIELQNIINSIGIDLLFSVIEFYGSSVFDLKELILEHSTDFDFQTIQLVKHFSSDFILFCKAVFDQSQVSSLQHRSDFDEWLMCLDSIGKEKKLVSLASKVTLTRFFLGVDSSTIKSVKNYFFREFQFSSPIFDLRLKLILNDITFDDDMFSDQLLKNLELINKETFDLNYNNVIHYVVRGVTLFENVQSKWVVLDRLSDRKCHEIRMLYDKNKQCFNDQFKIDITKKLLKSPPKLEHEFFVFDLFLQMLNSCSDNGMSLFLDDSEILLIWELILHRFDFFYKEIQSQLDPYLVDNLNQFCQLDLFKINRSVDSSFDEFSYNSALLSVQKFRQLCDIVTEYDRQHTLLVALRKNFKDKVSTMLSLDDLNDLRSLLSNQIVLYYDQTFYLERLFLLDLSDVTDDFYEFIHQQIKVVETIQKLAKQKKIESIQQVIDRSYFIFKDKIDSVSCDGNHLLLNKSYHELDTLLESVFSEFNEYLDFFEEIKQYCLDVVDRLLILIKLKQSLIKWLLVDDIVFNYFDFFTMHTFDDFDLERFNYLDHLVSDQLNNAQFFDNIVSLQKLSFLNSLIDYVMFLRDTYLKLSTSNNSRVIYQLHKQFEEAKSSYFYSFFSPLYDDLKLKCDRVIDRIH